MAPGWRHEDADPTISARAVSCALVGIRRLEHLEGLERAVNLELDAETMERLEQLFDINHGRPLQRGPAPEAYSW